MRSPLLVAIFLLIGCHVFCQKQGQLLIDSLLNEVPKMGNDSLKTRLYKRIADEYFYVDTDKALIYSKLGLKFASRAKWNRAIGAFNLSIARAYADKGSYDSCMFFNKRALAIYTMTTDDVNIAAVHNNMGAAEQNLRSNYTKASEHYFSALKIGEKLEDDNLIALSYDNLSHIFFSQSNYQKALDYEFKSLSLLQKQVGKSRDIGNALAAIASIYTDMKDAKNAKIYFSQALPLLEESGNMEGLAEAYSNLSILAGTDYSTRIDYGLKAEKLWTAVNPMHLEAVNNLGSLGYAYLEMAKNDSIRITGNSRAGLLKLAQNYLEQAIIFSRQKGDISSNAYFRGVLAEAQEQLGDYKNAYLNFRAYQTVQDSLFSQETKNKIAGLEGKREIELRDKQIELNKLALQAQKKQQFALVGGVVLLAIIGGLLFLQNHQRKRTNAALSILNIELDKANKTKARFFAILSHDLRSPVANLISFLHLQKEEPELLSPEITELHQKRITESAERLLENMESMLLWSKGQMENFEPKMTAIAIDEVFLYIQRFFEGNLHVHFIFQNPDSLTLVTDEDYLKTIMQNLTNNAVKALKDTPNAMIRWEAREEKDDIILTIRDNGPGASADQLRALHSEDDVIGIKSGLGLHLIRDLAKAISCTISFKQLPESGMEFELVFPKMG